ncbi:hypothetical protein B1C81_18580 [Streptomyces sp. HG99]|nr:hypothetical protein B1C81_18580 [Streptomyces sp. HG99]
MPGWKTGASVGIAVNMRIRIGERNVTNKALSYTVLRTVTRFCQSADRTIQRHHVPRLRGIEAEDLHAQLVDVVLPYANRAWEDVQNPQEGVVRFDHDHYLKIWALTEPRIEADFLLLDEAQDTNPVVEKIFNSQRDHSQRVMVGDSAQAIYGWRGARDVMSAFGGTQLALSQSFRFGSALAEEANRWLHIVDSRIRLTGTPAISTRLERVQEPERDPVPVQRRRDARSHAPAVVRVPRENLLDLRADAEHFLGLQAEVRDRALPPTARGLAEQHARVLQHEPPPGIAPGQQHRRRRGRLPDTERRDRRLHVRHRVVDRHE